MPSGWSEKNDLLRRSGLDRALGFRQPDSQGRLFADDAAANWFQPLTGQVVVQPDPSLVGIDHRSDLMADAPFGLGLHHPLLVPTLWLRLVLALHPVEEPFVLHDGTGPALAMITWRSHYETGTYHLPWPRTLGSALVASPEAFDKLLNWGEESLVVRELAHADSSLANAAGASSG